jgi:hypothetical protein
MKNCDEPSESRSELPRALKKIRKIFGKSEAKKFLLSENLHYIRSQKSIRTL